ncbi:Uncharacterised protein [Vibrio cholerae]|nr:Uncharacterised protein [Vibrio cholerae]CSI14919.1 Uncharacterised protein [Vibrio cholerae]CSI84925.1 Uncharacterised protein [Vibrio cholerae]
MMIIKMVKSVAQLASKGWTKAKIADLSVQ